jgi:hypothetical protein
MENKNEISVIPDKRDDSQIQVVSRRDVDALKQQRELLREFVQSQLVEADFKNKDAANFGEGDYGTIPGTKKSCLLKQGAEKMLKLFQMGCRFKLVDKEIDRHANFAMFTYKAEIYSLRSPDIIIAECDGSVNSQEVKYKERTSWEDVLDKKGAKTGRREQKKVETPIYDVLNTLMKMAQKRAMIGATILATGASEYFTQDMLDEDDLKEVNEGRASEDAAIEPRDMAPQSEPPVCCDKKMMISKYENRDGERAGKKDYYCLKCKSTQPREPQ